MINLDLQSVPSHQLQGFVQQLPRTLERAPVLGSIWNDLY
jgi:hypothetical protein